MSYECTQWALKQTVQSVSAKLVLLTLACHANPQGECWPSIELLKKETELSKRTILRALDFLKQKDLIEVKKHPKKKRSNYYFLKSYPQKGCHGDTYPSSIGANYAKIGVTVSQNRCHGDTQNNKENIKKEYIVNNNENVQKMYRSNLRPLADHLKTVLNRKKDS